MKNYWLDRKKKCAWKTALTDAVREFIEQLNLNAVVAHEYMHENSLKELADLMDHDLLRFD